MSCPGWVEDVPLFVRRILHVGCGAGEVGSRLKERPGVEVYGLERSPEAAALARDRLDGVVEDAGDFRLPFPNGFFDGILVSPGYPLDDSTLGALAPLLDTHGIFLIVESGVSASREREGDADMGKAGLIHYATKGDLLVFVRPDYNPITHARQLAEAGRPDLGFEVLSHIPKPYLAHAETLAAVMAEKLLNLLAMDAQAGPRDRLARFSTALGLFQLGTAQAPAFGELCQCQAEVWRRLGDGDMAARVLRTIQRVAPTDSAQRQLDSLGAAVPPERQAEWTAPEWSPGRSSPRVLLITHPRPHYGLDVLYDGLCTVLGESNVLEFPWKPSLHGQPPRKFANYPCIFDHAGGPLPLERILGRLRDREFDLILYGDMELSLDQAVARSLIEAAGDLPLFVVDGQDDPADKVGAVLEYLGGATALGYFKREMLACYDYGLSTYPLPFAYPDGRIPADISGPRQRAVFWAGARNTGLRRLFVERVEQLLGDSLDVLYRQEDYARMMRTSRIGLSCFGYGFDTVRYWELPAHGCLLLSERPPIRIPHNFRDGESAVFFDDLEDLEETLAYWLAHPDEARAIAITGYEHLNRHHTASARARHLLGWVENTLRE